MSSYGGGTVEREHVIGRDRMDLCLKSGSVTLGIGLKTWRNKTINPEPEGLQQLDSYYKPRTRRFAAVGFLLN
ncbi:hypothetical protein [Calothrix sp. NIES-3974]|uniref:hypothetical protein n=1 Tax=Calothrix sp. NIES-3974 TaxID=2005462 RepID=UPI0018D5A59E|nr:hypothetical protein [Calothrix sp. NIES-3974]